jgi:drug/metabolite transporter (DMT)-like permease
VARLDASSVVLLTLPPLMWAGNAVAGRLLRDLMPPMLLNFSRWALAALILLPLAGWVLRPGSGVGAHWRRFAVLGLFSVTAFNSLLYLAAHTSSALNITLVAASTPLWMLLIGALLYRTPISARQAMGAVLSMAGVAVVVSGGQWQRLLAVQLVPGDAYMLLAALLWAWYSWMLTRRDEPAAIRADWAAFLLAQCVFGLAFSALLVGAEQALHASAVQWGWPLAVGLVFVALGPSIVAYRCWGLGIARHGPTVAGFFSNLTPLLAAVLSAAMLGEPPQGFHGLAFALIVIGIVLAQSGARR